MTTREVEVETFTEFVDVLGLTVNGEESREQEERSQLQRHLHRVAWTLQHSTDWSDDQNAESATMTEVCQQSVA